MKVATRLHNITLSGDYLDKLPNELQDMFLAKAKPVTYYSTWDVPEGISREDWKVLESENSVEDLFKLYPKYENLKLIAFKT